MNKEAMRKLLEDCFQAGVSWSEHHPSPNMETWITTRLAALDDGQEGKGRVGWLNELIDIRNKLYDEVPTGTPENWDLLQIIRWHMNDLDNFMSKIEKHNRALPVADGEGEKVDWSEDSGLSKDEWELEKIVDQIRKVPTLEAIGILRKISLPSAVTGGVKWVKASERLPDEGGRYWCYVEEINDLGISHYQWNVSYHEIEKRFYTEKGGIVTHWMPLPPSPGQPAQGGKPFMEGKDEKCPRCHGDGIIEKHIPGYEGVPEKDVMIQCPDCEGSGIQP